MKSQLKLYVLLLLMLPSAIIFAQSGKILVEERFVENDRGWNLGDDNFVTRKIEDGKMHLECKKNLSPKGSGGYWIKLPDFKLPATNYSITFTTHWIKNAKTDDKYNPYGVILGDYYFLIYGDGDRRLLKYDTAAKKYETIVDWGVNAAIVKRDNGDNKFEIRYSEGKAALYANGQMLYKKEIAIPDKTPIKLYVENSEVVTFDDLVVKNL